MNHPKDSDIRRPGSDSSSSSEISTVRYRGTKNKTNLTKDVLLRSHLSGSDELAKKTGSSKK